MGTNYVKEKKRSIACLAEQAAHYGIMKLRAKLGHWVGFSATIDAICEKDDPDSLIEVDPERGAGETEVAYGIFAEIPTGVWLEVWLF